MRTKTLTAITVLALGCSGVAIARTGDTLQTTAKATKGGSAKKPVPVAASLTTTISGAGGAREETPTVFTWSWAGITENGGAFPVCTAAQIDAAQSDSKCPKGSLVGTGLLVAKAGPATDVNSSVLCKKTLHLYNSGAGKLTLFPVGPASDCAGLNYLPPVPTTWKTKGGTSVQTVPIPDNVAHPLPGLDVGFVNFNLSYKKLTVTKGGKKIGYLQSNGCKGSRAFSVTQKNASTPAGISAKATAGSC